MKTTHSTLNEKPTAGLATDPIEDSPSPGKRTRLRKRPRHDTIVPAEPWDAWIDQVIVLVKDSLTGEIVGELAWKDGRDNSHHKLEELHRFCKDRVRVPRLSTRRIFNSNQMLEYYQKLLYVFPLCALSEGN